MTRPIPIASYLADSARKSAASGRGAHGGATDFNPEADHEMWFERGREAGQRAEAEVRQAELVQLTVEAAADMERARTEWAKTEGARLASSISSAFDDLEREIATAVATVLTPFVEKRVLDDAVAEVARCILELSQDRDAVSIRLSGRADLIGEVRKHLPETMEIETRPGGMPELRVESGRTLIELQMDRWMQRLEEAVREQR